MRDPNDWLPEYRVKANEWLRGEIEVERTARRAADARLMRLKVGVQIIGHRARAALAEHPQPTSSMVSLDDMRYERALLRSALQTISEMVDEELLA